MRLVTFLSYDFTHYRQITTLLVTVKLQWRASNVIRFAKRKKWEICRYSNYRSSIGFVIVLWFFGNSIARASIHRKWTKFRRCNPVINRTDLTLMSKKNLRETYEYATRKVYARMRYVEMKWSCFRLRSLKNNKRESSISLLCNHLQNCNHIIPRLREESNATFILNN